MPYTQTAKNIMLNHLARAISHASLHDGIPTASNEIKDKKYSRQRVELNEAFDGLIRMKSDVRFNVAEGSKIDHAALWTAKSGGVMLAWGAVKLEEYSGDGIYILDTAKLDLNLN